MSETAIEWTDKVWNPVTGCTKVSAGCQHCYAEGFWLRFHPGFDFRNVLCHEDRLEQPLRWRKPAHVFVNSMSDLFHPDVPDEFIDRVFATMALTPQHTYQILTKRPERMREYFTRAGGRDGTLMTSARASGFCIEREMRIRCASSDFVALAGYPSDPITFPLPNVWLGVSVEDQNTLKRAWELLKTPAARRFVSLEPLLGPVDLDALELLYEMWRRGATIGTYLDWVIVGGESGPKARPCDVAWIRSIVQQCQAACVPVFVKQDSGPRPGKQGRIPDELWIKEMPR